MINIVSNISSDIYLLLSETLSAEGYLIFAQIAFLMHFLAPLGQANVQFVINLYVKPPPPPLEFAKLNITDITGNEKNSYFSYLCTSTVIRQTESIHKITIK